MINKAIIVGNITAQPELKALPNGTSVANFTVVTNRVFKDKAGQKQEQAEYHKVVVYGKQAENCAHYLVKGQQVAIEGRIQTRSWDHEGQKRYMTEIICDSVHFGRKPQGATSNREGVDEPSQAGEENQAAQADEINPDDIPF